MVIADMTVLLTVQRKDDQGTPVDEPVVLGLPVSLRCRERLLSKMKSLRGTSCRSGRPCIPEDIVGLKLRTHRAKAAFLWCSVATVSAAYHAKMPG